METSPAPHAALLPTGSEISQPPNPPPTSAQLVLANTDLVSCFLDFIHHLVDLERLRRLNRAWSYCSVGRVNQWFQDNLPELSVQFGPRDDGHMTGFTSVVQSHGVLLGNITVTFCVSEAKLRPHVQQFAANNPEAWQRVKVDSQHMYRSGLINYLVYRGMSEFCQVPMTASTLTEKVKFVDAYLTKLEGIRKLREQARALVVQGQRPRQAYIDTLRSTFVRIRLATICMDNGSWKTQGKLDELVRRSHRAVDGVDGEADQRRRELKDVGAALELTIQKLAANNQRQLLQEQKGLLWVHEWVDAFLSLLGYEGSEHIDYRLPTRGRNLNFIISYNGAISGPTFVLHANRSRSDIPIYRFEHHHRKTRRSPGLTFEADWMRRVSTSELPVCAALHVTCPLRKWLEILGISSAVGRAV